ncbi:hypothetical protein [Streptomyces sp. 030-HV]|uniref:hypothetical protein n=1 Tax=Streptomyces sp. 030-HV TaxID=2789262 RepID=UPI00397FEDEB
MRSCTICGHGLSDVRALRTTCEACQSRITQQLALIEGEWPHLADALEPARGHSGPRVSGTPAWTLPAEQVLNLIGPGGIHSRLYVRYADLAVARGLQPTAMPSGPDARLAVAIRGIRRHLPWAVQAINLRELADEARQCAADLKVALGTAEKEVTVPCPGPDADAPCLGRLRFDRDRNRAYCRTCRIDLDPGEWLEHALKIGYLTA